MTLTVLGGSDYNIHHPNKVELYEITREQLELLARSGESDWKSKWQSALSILMTCLINIMALGWDTGSASFRLNLGIGLIALIVGIIFLVLYCRDRRKQNTMINEILQMPVQTKREE